MPYDEPDIDLQEIVEKRRLRAAKEDRHSNKCRTPDCDNQRADHSSFCGLCHPVDVV